MTTSLKPRTPRDAAVLAISFVLVPLFVLLAIGIYQIWGNPGLKRSREGVVHTFTVLSAVQTVEHDIQDAETGQRGFLLTGEESYLAPYKTGTGDIPRIMSELHVLVAGQADQSARVLALQGYLTTKLDELRRTVELRRTQGLEAARDIVLTNIGQTSMQDIRRTVGEIEASETALLEQRLATAGDAEDRTSFAIFLGSVVATLSVAVGAALLLVAYNASFRSESVTRATLESVREGVGAFDARGRLTNWNKLFTDLLALPASFVRPGLTLAELEAFDRERGGTVISNLPELADTSRADGKPIVVERALEDGRIYEIFHNGLAGEGSVLTFMDTTERRKMEQFYQQAQKMDSLGQMTGGVAHDFNNILTIILGNLETLRATEDPDRRLRSVNVAFAAVERGARLTRQLLAFARKQPLEPQPLNLAKMVPDVVEMLRHTLGEQVEIVGVVAGGLWNTLADPTQVQSALLNLALNSRDAMPNGGKLTIEAANAYLDEAYAAHHSEVTPGQYVMLAVTDTGEGMSPEIVAKAFDPFFTTKPEGKGTGLGLSMVFGFLKQSGGHVKIYSEIGHGTTIKLYLPRTGQAEPEQPREKLAPSVPGSELVLVVEDDAAVRATVAATIRDLGYRVAEADGGAAALAFLESGERVDLIFTDVVMPGPVTSRALAQAAIELQPHITVLYTSGYTENSIVHNGRLDEGVQLLSKPYRREELAIKLQAILQRGRAVREEQGTIRPNPSA
ncbi:MAG TPA: CHASE3 domain-containing protein [Aliidongia sp.]|nr:CHASE3 domain-containing protein [Aliidongia sp.]